MTKLGYGAVGGLISSMTLGSTVHDYNNTEHVRAYAVRDGEVIQVSCANTALQVRQ